MVKGAAFLGWKSLRSLSSKDGLGRRWAMSRYWQERNARTEKIPAIIKQVMREASQ